MTISRNSLLLAPLCMPLILMLSSTSMVSASTCAADEQEGVRVQACRVGDDIQVLAHNSNDYSVNVDVRTTYIDKDGTQIKHSSARVESGSGGQIDLIQVRPHYSLKQVVDISIKDIARR